MKADVRSKAILRLCACSPLSLEILESTRGMSSPRARQDRAVPTPIAQVDPS